MDRLKNIIVVADFSEASDNAILQAMRIAQWNDAVLHVLHVIDEIEAVEAIELYGLKSPGEVRAQLCEHVRLRLAAYVPVGTHGSPMEDNGEITFDVTIGDTFVDVLQAVDDLSADLLVVGHDRVGGPEVVGHLARRFARKASTKVMLIRPGEPQSFRRVIACVDFSDLTNAVIEQGIRVARQENAELHIVHAPVSVKRLFDLLDLSGELSQSRRAEQMDQMKLRMKRLLKPYAPMFEGLSVKSHVLPHSTILKGLNEFLDEGEPTLAVIGSRGRKNFKGLLMGSTAETLVDAAHCSTLVIKPPEFRYQIG